MSFKIVFDGDAVRVSTRVKMKWYSHLKSDLAGATEERYKQAHHIWQMNATLNALEQLAVEGNVEIGMHDGYSSHQGQLVALNEEAFKIADNMLSELPFKLQRFADKYPHSSFTFTYEQRRKQPDEE